MILTTFLEKVNALLEYLLNPSNSARMAFSEVLILLILSTSRLLQDCLDILILIILLILFLLKCISKLASLVRFHRLQDLHFLKEVLYCLTNFINSFINALVYYLIVCQAFIHNLTTFLSLL